MKHKKEETKPVITGAPAPLPISPFLKLKESETAGNLILEADKKTGLRLWRRGYRLQPGETRSYHPTLGMVVSGGKK